MKKSGDNLFAPEFCSMVVLNWLKLALILSL
jgi:hypothetical protein